MKNNFSVSIMILIIMCVLPFPLNVRQVSTLRVHRTRSIHDPPYAYLNRTYGGGGNDYIFNVMEADYGSLVIAGFTDSFGAGFDDFWLVKTDHNGDILWNYTYGWGSYDSAWSAVQTADGGYALAGSSGTYSIPLLVKIDANGTHQWNQTYFIPTSDLMSVVQTSDGGYALAGSTDTTYVDSDFWLLKTDAAGNHQWNHTYGGIDEDFGWSVVQTLDGGYAIAGATYSFGAGPCAVWLVKTDTAGNHQWNHTYGGSDGDWGWSIVLTTDGGYAIVGGTWSFGAGSADVWLLKIDAVGNIQWNQTYGGTDFERGDSVVQTSDGGYAIAGFTASYGAGEHDVWVMKTDSEGNLLWNQTYGGTGLDYGTSVVQTSDGGYAIAAFTDSFGAGGIDAWVIRLVADYVHDVAVVDMVTSKTGCTPAETIGQGMTTEINVTAGNQATYIYYIETFNVTIYANATKVDSQEVTLNPTESQVLTYTWDTSLYSYGNYNITAIADAVPGETEVADNNYFYGWMFVTIPGDIDGDRDVDIFDIVPIADAYGSVEGAPAYNPNCDIDGDGDVDIFDVVIAAGNYGESW